MSDRATAQKIAAIAKVLSVDTRVRILQLLQQQPFCVNALAARLEVTHSAVSQHLRILRNAGLVTAEKRGYWVHYRLNEDTTRRWRDALSRLLSG